MKVGTCEPGSGAQYICSGLYDILNFDLCAMTMLNAEFTLNLLSQVFLQYVMKFGIYVLLVVRHHTYVLFFSLFLIF